jgi:hypothetical protein
LSGASVPSAMPTANINIQLPQSKKYTNLVINADNVQPFSAKNGIAVQWKDNDTMNYFDIVR